MDLLEYQGKALLHRHGIPIPKGALWPDLPGCEGRIVLKAQVASGKRGKRGGIRVLDGPETAQDAVREMESLIFDGETVSEVYLEECLDIARELYLAFAVDRDRRCPVLLASPEGGIDVEEAPADALLRLPIDPFLGLREFHIAAAARWLGVGVEAREQLAGVVRSLYSLMISEDAELVEINPLVVTGDGNIVAADAKVSLDDNAAFRRQAITESREPSQTRMSQLEQAVAEAGAVGIEIDPDGDIVAVVSGAGLMMATLDILCQAGLRVRAVVDLGGSVLAGGEVLGRVFQAVVAAGPQATFLNAYMHTALCDELARMLIEAQQIAPLEGQVVVRLKGRNSDAGRSLLADQGFEVFEDLAPAIQALTQSRELV
ncbi:ATP-grasp domain-containing protein [Fodinicurvata halophila]|uniref:ATP-grasp domain-containing protein n=1 Tax=Fodinicurvata halophila TaxID=1419723 RepID=A0ABV8UNU6_9PROT